MVYSVHSEIRGVEMKHGRDWGEHRELNEEMKEGKAYTGVCINDLQNH